MAKQNPKHRRRSARQHLYAPPEAVRCPVQGKILYLTEDDATRAADATAGAYRLPFHTYRCRHCGYWHLTTRTPPTGENR